MFESIHHGQPLKCLAKYYRSFLDSGSFSKEEDPYQSILGIVTDIYTYTYI